MQNAVIIFENSLLAKKGKESELLEDLTFNLALQTPNKDLNHTLNAFLQVLERLNLLNPQNTTTLIKALIKAKIQQKQNTLYALINELGALEAQIETQKSALKNEVSETFFDLKQSIDSSAFATQISSGIDDAFLFEVGTLGILKETAESAFITTLERGEDIELTISEIAKNLIYNAICEANFAKKNIIQSSKIVLNSAFELANESKNLSREIVRGVVKGTQDGIGLGVEKFKKSFQFCSFEEDLSLKEREIIGLEDDFITLLRTLCVKFENPVRNELQSLLNGELDGFFAKFKRLIVESREQLILNINELRKKPHSNDFSRMTQNKLDSLQSELKQMSAHRYADFNLNQAKKLGVSLWEKAKNLVNFTK